MIHDDVPEVIFERRGRLGLVTLNRPRAINALTHGMITAMTEQLLDWASDDDVQTVALTGAGERGLCAGGDIVSLYRAAVDGDPDAAVRFWTDEYALDAMIADYSKPFVAIMDGIVLGGGIGLSAHASHRVVTERSSLGLPEVGIGFMPDVGSTRLLARAPGELGTHLALTGKTFGPGDALELGFADAFVPSERLPELVSALADEPADAVLARLRAAPPDSPAVRQRDWIDAAYVGDDVRAILDRLESSTEAAARDAAATMRTKSPTSLAVTLLALRRSRDLPSLEAVLEQDRVVSTNALTAPDFAEGVRAQVIDKDRSPGWNPATIPAPRDVEWYFEEHRPR